MLIVQKFIEIKLFLLFYKLFVKIFSFIIINSDYCLPILLLSKKDYIYYGILKQYSLIFMLMGIRFFFL